MGIHINPNKISNCDKEIPKLNEKIMKLANRKLSQTQFLNKQKIRFYCQFQFYSYKDIRLLKQKTSMPDHAGDAVCYCAFNELCNNKPPK